VIKGVGLSENIRSTSSDKIRSFLNPNKFLFIDMPALKKGGFKGDWLNFMQEEVKLFNNNSDLKNL